MSSAPPVGLISPHLDDVVLSCAAVITPGSRVVTVFASGPQSVDPVPAWDQRCGFQPGDDVSAARRREDDAALGLFGAEGVRLDYWAYQYRAHGPRLERIRRQAQRVWPRPAPERLVRRVASELHDAVRAAGLSVWYLPLGVGHPDHLVTTAAALRVARSLPEIEWVIYEDLPYARQGAPLLDAAVRRLIRAGFALGPMQVAGPDREVDKRAAVACYRSQLPALGDLVEVALAGPERYHRLLDRPLRARRR